MPTLGFELTVSAGERLQTHALDHVATGTDRWHYLVFIIVDYCLIKKVWRRLADISRCSGGIRKTSRWE